jgi:hypothetical protein
MRRKAVLTMRADALFITPPVWLLKTGPYHIGQFLNLSTGRLRPEAALTSDI